MPKTEPPKGSKPGWKPQCELPEGDNIYAVAAVASRVLKDAGMREQKDRMLRRIPHAKDYDAAVAIIKEYVDAV
jgi:hypothetical protein